MAFLAALLLLLSVGFSTVSHAGGATHASHLHVMDGGGSPVGGGGDGSGGDGGGGN